MEALSGGGPPQVPLPKFQPNTDQIHRRLHNSGVEPTPKIVHALRKKLIQKHRRRLAAAPPPPTPSQLRELAAESTFRAIRREYLAFTRALKPWEERHAAAEELAELREMFELRRRDELRWVLDDDVEVKQEWLGSGESLPPKRRSRSEAQVIQFLVDRICGTRFSRRDWKLKRMMKQSGLEFTECQLLRIVDELGSKKGCWEKALYLVECVYEDTKQKKISKSRFVYTKLLAVLGKARRPEEALKVFNTMLGDFDIYPDMAAYHSISVTLGQAGYLKDLIKVMESMSQTPTKRIKNMNVKNWDPALEPDIVIYNAILNACVPSHQWKGVSWVFKQLRVSGLKPNGATYGLSMEVMLHSEKYDLVHEYFRKMTKSGETPKAITYKVLVRTFSNEGKVNEAVEAVREMEQRGVVGASSVYYELACCLCSHGRWEDAMFQVIKMKKLSNTRPLEVTFTGMIKSSMHSGHVNDCILIFEHMKTHCSPNIGTLNVMLKVYGRNDMFSKAKALFETIRKLNIDSSVDHDHTAVVPDEYTYNSMLEASASACQWEYFEYVYREMVLSGYQLDQSRFSSLLIEASKAGKSHLLEHTFDAILKAGEIPNPLYFTEMLLQATVRDDYDRSVTLIDAMALAPFQFSEVQWKEFFEKNTERISRNHLEKLLDSLDNCTVKCEATVVNLSRALNSIIDLCSDKPSVDSKEEISPGIPEEWIDEDSDSDEEYVDELVERVLSNSLTGNHYDDDDETGFETLLNKVDESDKTNSPSGIEVLEAWNESRKKDGSWFSSQLGRK